MRHRPKVWLTPALVDEIRRVVKTYCTYPIQREAMLRVLERPGFALHEKANCRAGVLSLRVYEAIKGPPSAFALRGAAGVELQMEAAYLFDDVADQEINPSQGLNAAEELSLAIAMLSCGSAAAAEAACHPGLRYSGKRAVKSFHYNCISACAGQFLDAHLEKRESATSEEALEMTSLKSGSIGRFAAEFGARLATDDPTTIKLVSDFGFNTFTYGQLADDLRDACPANLTLGDLAREKKTLPVVFLKNFVLKSGCKDNIKPRTTDSDWKPSDVRGLFGSSGAELFGFLVAETFLNQARANLDELSGRVREVKGLEEFLESLVASSEELAVVS